MKPFWMVLVLAPTWARADVITCRFTEPFITTTYSMAQSTLTIKYDTERLEIVLKGISFQIQKAELFELWDQDHRVIQRLHLSFRGSDGMSDLLYPYEAAWTTAGLRGGCTSNQLTVKPAGVDPDFATLGNSAAMNLLACEPASRLKQKPSVHPTRQVRLPGRVKCRNVAPLSVCHEL